MFRDTLSVFCFDEGENEISRFTFDLPLLPQVVSQHEEHLNEQGGNSHAAEHSLVAGGLHKEAAATGDMIPTMDEATVSSASRSKAKLATRREGHLVCRAVCQIDHYKDDKFPRPQRCL